MRNETAKRLTVAAAIAPGFGAFELALVEEVFGPGAAPAEGDWYRFFVCAPGTAPIPSSSGFQLAATRPLSALRSAGTIVVPPISRPGRADPELVAALLAAARRGARLLTICTGAFVLAEAGLLDGRRATTHWAHTDELATLFPAVQVEPGVLYVEDGNILTSAGSAAGLDACLHVVRQDFGASVANDVARQLVVAPHRDGGQAQFIAQPVPVPVAADPFAETLQWMVEHLDQELSVEVLARRSAMSPRTFARRFVTATGTTPHRYLTAQRVLFAQRLLESTNLDIDQIATRTGFGTAVNLRTHFRRQVRTSPASYRRTFRAA